MSYTADRHRKTPRIRATLRNEMNQREHVRELARYGKDGSR